MPRQYKVRFVTERIIDTEMIANLIVSAIEGGCNHWLGSFRLGKSDRPTSESPWYADPGVWSGDFQVDCRPAERDDFSPIEFTPAMLRNGLDLMGERHPQDLDDVANGDDDASTADTFLQLCLFGKVIYG